MPHHGKTPRSLASLGMTSLGASGGRSVLPFHHVDFGAILPELDFIHELVDEKNPAAVIGVDVLTNRTTGDGLRLETSAGISHHNQDAALFIAAHQAFYSLAGVFFGAVNHGIGQRLLQ